MSKLRVVALSLLVWCVLIAFGVGLFLGLRPKSPSFDFWMRVVAAVAMVTVGLTRLLSVRSGDPDRVRSRTIAFALLAGALVYVPGLPEAIKLTIAIAMLLAIIAAVSRRPKEIFAPRT